MKFKFQKGNKYRLGKKHSEETKHKMSVSQTGRKHSEETKKKIGLAHVGKKVIFSREWKKKQSERMKGNGNIKWKGGITPLVAQIRHCFKNRQWISDIFTRDDFTCQECNKRGGWLVAHHIKFFAIILNENKIKTLEQALKCEELWNINNGKTLCEKCHKIIHKHGQ